MRPALAAALLPTYLTAMTAPIQDRSHAPSPVGAATVHSSPADGETELLSAGALALDELFRELARLNPDAVSLTRAAALRHAERLPSSCFDHFAERALAIAAAFAGTPFKINQRAVLDEYFAALCDPTARLAAGTIPPPQESPPGLAGRLLPARQTPGEDWLSLAARANVPEKLHRAIAASANRNDVVDTPMELVFSVLHRLDAGKAFAWSIAQLRDNPQFGDADIVRDLIAVWNQQAAIPRDAGRLLLGLLEDSRLERFWPGASLQANRLVRRLALEEVLGGQPGKGADWRRLGQILTGGGGATAERSLERWLDDAVNRLGRHVGSFIACAKRLQDLGDNPEHRGMARRQIHTDVREVNALHPAIMVGADLFLRRANGTHALAMAFLGIDRGHLKKWRRQLEQQAATVVRRLLLEDLRHRRDSVETIRAFCLGDEMLFTTLYLKLDLLSKQFGSIAERERVVDVLAVNYASFRETELLQDKISRHYRQLARLLHEDSLRHLLPEDAMASCETFGELPSALARATEARRYLEGRRALDSSLEDMCAAELTFEQQLRSARASLVRKLLAGPGRGCPSG